MLMRIARRRPARRTLFRFGGGVRLFAEHKKKLLATTKVGTNYNAWRTKNPDKAKILDDGLERKVPPICSRKFLTFPKMRSWRREKPEGVLQPIAPSDAVAQSGSADLYGSTMNYIDGGGDFNRDDPGGVTSARHSRTWMCAILNGISYHGLFRASGATFAVFHGLLPPCYSLAALAKLPNTYIFTHDSIGVR